MALYKHRANMRIRQSEENLAITLRSIGDGVIGSDAAGRIARMNPVAAALTGWTESETLGLPIETGFHIVSEQTRAPSVNPVAATLTYRLAQGLANPTALIARDGTERSIADSCAPMRDDTGRIIGAVLVFCDVTTEHAARRALREKEAALREMNDSLERIVSARTGELRNSEKRLEYALEAARDGLWDWDFASGRVHYSQIWAQLLGYAPEEVPQRVEFFFSVLHPGDIDRVRAWMDEHFAGRTPIKEGEVRLRRKSREYRWFLDRGKVVARDEAGMPSRMVGTITDIGESRRLRMHPVSGRRRVAGVPDEAPAAARRPARQCARQSE